MDQGDAHTLAVIAIFCIAMSVMTTCLFAVFGNGSGDYDYDAINSYRADLVEFSGGQLTNDNPWVLSEVYTPFTPGTIPDSEIPDHIENDNGRSVGWLFGENITNYPYIGKSANIKLDPDQMSNQLLRQGESVNYEYRNGKSWWAGNNDLGIVLLNPDTVKYYATKYSWTGLFDGIDPNYGYETVSGTVNNWNYTGYRYVFDPVLPFNDQASSKDGRLSILWYKIENDSGISGALEVYGTSNGEVIKYGEVHTSDIIGTFLSTAGYVQVFDFNFQGTHLNLTIRFDPTVYETYSSVQQAWDAGAWSMAISSASAGNFFDVETSNAFNVTAGSMLDTFIQIYTFEYPHFENDSWMEFIMWMLVGLPATLGMLLITIRLVGGVFKIF